MKVETIVAHYHLCRMGVYSVTICLFECQPTINVSIYDSIAVYNETSRVRRLDRRSRVSHVQATGIDSKQYFTTMGKLNFLCTVKFQKQCF